MREGIHPEYREVVFQDMQNDFKFITRSTAQTRETIEMDGKTYPLFKLDTSSESHPFYTGAQTRIVETGRVEDVIAKPRHRYTTALLAANPGMPRDDNFSAFIGQRLDPVHNLGHRGFQQRPDLHQPRVLRPQMLQRRSPGQRLDPPHPGR